MLTHSFLRTSSCTTIHPNHNFPTMFFNGHFSDVIYFCSWINYSFLEGVFNVVPYLDLVDFLDDARLIGWDHVFDIDKCIWTPSLLQDFQCLLNEVANIFMEPLMIINSISSVHWKRKCHRDVIEDCKSLCLHQLLTALSIVIGTEPFRVGYSQFLCLNKLNIGKSWR